MCRFISFFHKPDADGKPEIAVWDLTGHGETERHLELNLKVWQEGHYTPDGVVELRNNPNFRLDKAESGEVFKARFPVFKDFLKWCLKQEISGYLDLSGCDLKGITLPTSVGGYLDLSGCDLKGIKLPESVGGSLDLSGCDLKGIKLPESVGGYLYLSGCDLKGINIPKKYKNKVIK